VDNNTFFKGSIHVLKHIHTNSRYLSNK